MSPMGLNLERVPLARPYASSRNAALVLEYFKVVL
jgi:hypothetical protein